MKKDFVILTIGRNRLRKIFLNEILYFKASGSYSVVKMEKKEVLISKVLKEIEKLIEDENFIRINRSYIINLQMCLELKTGTNSKIIMKNNEEIKLSENYSDLIFNKFCGIK
jgi:two-component system LytT family response regulator